MKLFKFNETETESQTATAEWKSIFETIQTICSVKVGFWLILKSRKGKLKERQNNGEVWSTCSRGVISVRVRADVWHLRDKFFATGRQLLLGCRSMDHEIGQIKSWMLLRLVFHLNLFVFCFQSTSALFQCSCLIVTCVVYPAVTPPQQSPYYPHFTEETLERQFYVLCFNDFQDHGVDKKKTSTH